MSDDITQRARGRLIGVSLEQVARNLLEECGVEDAQRFTAGDLVALAEFVGLLPDLVAEVERLRIIVQNAERFCLYIADSPNGWVGEGYEIGGSVLDVLHGEPSGWETTVDAYLNDREGLA